MAGRKKDIEGVGAEKSEVLVALGIRIRNLRNAAGKSQRQFAAESGVTQSYMYLLEGGGPNVSVGVLDKMAKVLGVSIREFFAEHEGSREAADPVLAGVAKELRRLGDALEARKQRDNAILDDIEARLAVVKEITEGLLKEREEVKGNICIVS